MAQSSPVRKNKKRKSKKFKDDNLSLIEDLGVDEDSQDDFALNVDIKSTIRGDTEFDESILFDAVIPDVSNIDEINHLDDDAEINDTPKTYTVDAKSPIGGSDEQILRDIRKLIFSIPLLHQEDVNNLFDKIDANIFPIVYKILNTSKTAIDSLLQIIVRVGAGNTYGKNIYEKVIDCQEDDLIESRGTYKDHEISFLTQVYPLVRLYAINNTENSVYSTKFNVEKSVTGCSFIRGVYEDILEGFIKKTENYNKYHWSLLEAKLSGDNDLCNKHIIAFSEIDKDLQLNKCAYYVARDANLVYKTYKELREKIINPYLRSVYSIAKTTAKNSHQLLENFQNGSIGLMRAVSCYSTKRNACFASVAKSWIKQMMLLSIKEDANFVKLPVSTWQAYTQIERSKNKLGIQEDNITAIAKSVNMTVKKVKSVLHTVKIAQVYSLNRTYDQDEKLTLEDIMTNDNKLCGDIDPFISSLRDYCTASSLSDIETKLLAVRFGMVDLIRDKEIDTKECIKECIVQNLAKLGYNYRLCA